MFYVQPVGSRSMGHVREEASANNKWSWDAECSMEMAALHAATLDPDMSYTQHRDAFSELKVRIGSAKAGKAKFPVHVRRRSECEADTIEMSGKEYLIELRQHTQKPRFGRNTETQRVARLYYFEPDSIPDQLHGLHLATKDARFADVAQNGSIVTADTRAWHWRQSQIGKGEDRNEVTTS
ncbi:hypothetical protein ACSYDW_06980 [Paeniglutamicibacter sp. R2-26]|uniref:hypothetical protein n=1 Tax=Paeniglutamicibacter sp. R2-26 TaxID=3144417 RepID=UPI003EE4CCB6